MAGLARQIVPVNGTKERARVACGQSTPLWLKLAEVRAKREELSLRDVRRRTKIKQKNMVIM